MRPSEGRSRLLVTVAAQATPLVGLFDLPCALRETGALQSDKGSLGMGGHFMVRPDLPRESTGHVDSRGLQVMFVQKGTQGTNAVSSRRRRSQGFPPGNTDACVPGLQGGIRRGLADGLPFLL